MKQKELKWRKEIKYTLKEKKNTQIIKHLKINFSEKLFS